MRYTNNTGWVDFIITPTVGTLWLLAEDTLDRYVSDTVQGGNRSRKLPKILRASLNPSRTMANAMRLKAPWYRDFQHSPELEKSYGVHFLPSDEQTRVDPLRRFSFSPYFRTMPFGTPAESCIVCIENPGGGVELQFAMMRWMSASFAAEKQSGLLLKNTTSGSTVSLGLGLALKLEGPRNTLSFAVRPGLVSERSTVPLYFDIHRKAYVNEVEFGHNSLTLMLSDDRRLTSRMSFRSSLSDTIIRYRTSVENRTGIGTPPHLSWLSKDEYSNKSTWSLQAGPVFRF